MPRKTGTKQRPHGARQRASELLTARERSLAYEGFKFPAADLAPAAALRGRLAERVFALEPGQTSFDWRTRIRIVAPGDQGRCNTCTSFALAAAIELSWLIANPGRPPISVSPGFIHTCLGHEGNGVASDVCATGIDLLAALCLVQEKGYALSTDGDYPFPAASCSSVPRAGRIAQFPALSGVNEAKRHLVHVGPIVADMYIWQDFFDYSVVRGPTYVPDMARTPAHPHSVCVVGFDSQGWIVKNSFGPLWGDGGGFATVPYDVCGLIGAPPPLEGYPRQAYGVVLQPEAGPGQV